MLKTPAYRAAHHPVTANLKTKDYIRFVERAKREGLKPSQYLARIAVQEAQSAAQDQSHGNL